MKIMLANNLTFKSFLPSESKIQTGRGTRDYWDDFAKECANNPKQKDKLNILLHELANNGDNNILALETTKGVTEGFQDNYFFRLYANNKDLLADRKEVSIMKQNRHLSKVVWIQPIGNLYSEDNFVELSRQFEIGKEKFGHQRFTARSITDALLYCLEKIVRDPQKQMFDLKNIEPTKYLKQFRKTV